MATNTAALKTFAQQTREKLISLVKTKMQYVLTADTAELRAYSGQIAELRKQIQNKTEKNVVEEVAYTWFNRVMALRFMDANGYNAPMIVTPAMGQTRPEILQEAMAGSIDDSLMLSADDKLLPEAKLYRKLLVAVCNHQMSAPMPFLFEPITTYTELLLPDDLLSDQSFVTDIRQGMTDEDCQNVEIMGWLYQFYITSRKAEAEAKKSKKGGLSSDEQAAATQLFTPHWIVRYMVENSLGRIWMTLHPESHLVDNMPYYIAPAEGQTDIIPEDIHSARDIRFLDPCMGSGHVLVYAFDLFAKMYEEEGEMPKDIPALILQNNLYGIDIDRRCYQLASFALTMKGRAYYRRYLRRTVNPNVIALEPIDHDTIASAGNWDEKSLMWQFENIDTIGSLLKVTPEECDAINVENGSIFSIGQSKLKKQAEYLSAKYHCVVTNPPYLGKGFGDALKEYVQKEYPNSKADTMATFMERCYEMLAEGGKYAMINMQSWMFISSFEKLRKHVLTTQTINTMVHLGPRTFDEISGEVVQSTAFVISRHKPKDDTCGVYYRLVDGKNCAEKERMFLERTEVYNHVAQTNFEKIPGMPLGYWVSEKIVETFTRNRALSAVCKPTQGLATADNARFLRQWFEVSESRIGFGFEDAASAARSQKKWFPYNKGGNQRRWYGNQDSVVNWGNDGFDIKHFNDDKGKQRSVVRNPDRYFMPSISWSDISSSSNSFKVYPKGFIFDVCGMSCFDAPNTYNLLGVLNTKFYAMLAHFLNPTMHFQIGNFKQLPYMEVQSEDFDFLVRSNISLSKLDWDSHETSWDFERNPLWQQQLEIILAEMQEQGVMPADATIDNIEQFHMPNMMQPIEVLVENYKREWEDHFMQLHDNEEELNRQFISIYGLEDELTPDVPLSEITILQKGEISIENDQIVWHNDVIIKQFISYLVGCLMGRYSIDKPGLIIASQGQKPEDIALPAHTLEIDDDGIIPVVMEEDFFVDDLTQRLEDSVKTLLGERHFQANIKYIESALGMDLRTYLFKNFYADHQQMYSVKGAKRPIYWLFSSQMGNKKKKGYFKALVYMHRMEGDTLSKLHADYVHPYLTKTEQQLREAEDNATRDDLTQAKHNKALKEVEALKEKVREVKAFETQLVEMASARITIDLDDGVKTNYPKFYPLVEPIKGLDSKEE